MGPGKEGKSWCLGHIDKFLALTKTPDIEFLRWAELYLSDGLCDPAHHKVVSFKNMYWRVPDSFNSKNGEPVRVIQEWDGQRPYINYILRDFYSYLVDNKKKPKKPSDYGGVIWGHPSQSGIREETVRVWALFHDITAHQELSGLLVLCQVY